MKTRRGLFVLPETSSGKIVKPPTKPAGNIYRRPPQRPTKKQKTAAFDWLKPWSN